MKKKIDFISLDSVLAKWLVDKLTREPPKSNYRDEFLDGICDLKNGKSENLMISMSTEDNYICDVNADICVGDLEIYLKNHKILLKDKEINLTPKEFDILYFLAQNRGQVFTKEQIYKAVWQDEYLLADSNIMAFIRKLRKKIEPDPDSPEYILTIWGIGYKFNDNL